MLSVYIFTEVRLSACKLYAFSERY